MRACALRLLLVLVACALASAAVMTQEPEAGPTGHAETAAPAD